MFKRFKPSFLSRSLPAQEDDIAIALASIEDAKNHAVPAPILTSTQASILDQIDKEWDLQQAAYARSKVERDLLIDANARINFEQDLLEKIRLRLIAESQAEKLVKLRTESEIQADQLTKERIALENAAFEKEAARVEAQEMSSS